jgi:AMME syndrome candidate gene 1 protein
MATIEHAVYCFETLHAELNHRTPLALNEVEASYAAYLAHKSDKSKQIPALQRLADTFASPASSSSASSTTSLSNGSSSAASAATSATSLSTADSAVAVVAAAAAATTKPAAPAETPLFVTWNTIEDAAQDIADGDEDDDDTEHILRGCIGCFDSIPLEEGLAAYALTAALDDNRFHPIAPRELRRLEVAVTLLTDFEPAHGGPEDWEVGKHGIRIAFRVGGFQYGSTYLPDVAAEQGGTKEQTLLNLMRKAGWNGRRDQWRKVDLRVTRYQGRRRRLTYKQYMAWREWADGQAAATVAAAAAK